VRYIIAACTKQQQGICVANLCRKRVFMCYRQRNAVPTTCQKLQAKVQSQWQRTFSTFHSSDLYGATTPHFVLRRLLRILQFLGRIYRQARSREKVSVRFTFGKDGPGDGSRRFRTKRRQHCALPQRPFSYPLSCSLEIAGLALAQTLAGLANMRVDSAVDCRRILSLHCAQQTPLGHIFRCLLLTWQGNTTALLALKILLSNQNPTVKCAAFCSNTKNVVSVHTGSRSVAT